MIIGQGTKATEWKKILFPTHGIGAMRHHGQNIGQTNQPNPRNQPKQPKQPNQPNQSNQLTQPTRPTQP